MNNTPILTYVIIFGIVFLPYAFLSFFLGKDIRPKRQSNTQIKELPPLFILVWWAVPFFQESTESILSLISSDTREKIENRILAANLRITFSQVVTTALLLAIVFSTLLTVILLSITSNGVILAGSFLIAALLGACYPFVSIDDIAETRQTQIMRSLPFAIDLIGSSMRAGIDFSAAIREYVHTEDKSNQLVVEFGIMLQQLELGKTRIEAMEEMARRIQVDEFYTFANAVAHSFEVGSPLYQTLKIQASEMRRVRFNIAERKAARAASAMIFPIVVFIMPAMILVIGTPVFIRVLSSGLGEVMK